MVKERTELVERGSPLRELNFLKSHSTVCKSSPPCQSFFFFTIGVSLKTPLHQQSFLF